MDIVPRQSVVAALVVSDMYSRMAENGISDFKALSHANVIGNYLTNLHSHYSREDFTKAVEVICPLIYS